VSAQDLENASKAARRKKKEIEDILLDEYQLRLPAVGEALGKFFGVPYESHKPTRVRPVDLLKNLKREYCESTIGSR